MFDNEIKVTADPELCSKSEDAAATGGEMQIGKRVKAKDGKMIPEVFLAVYENGLIYQVDSRKIRYTRKFYQQMYRLTEDEHLPVLEAYRKLGFDIDVTGVNRAYQAGKHAKEKGDKKKLQDIHPYDYVGRERKSEEELAAMTLEERCAYLQARNIYLEAVLSAQKKTIVTLADISSWS